jgi:NADH:ubiquinone oxidoreductase subunit 6 (subunit J)
MPGVGVGFPRSLAFHGHRIDVESEEVSMVLILGLAALLCGIQAIRTPRLLIASLWLAATSALVATLLFTLGAAWAAVIELSVGAGLVTVLLVFAIAVAGEEPLLFRLDSLIPAPLIWGLSILAVALLGWLILPLAVARPAAPGLPVAVVLWQHRGLDLLLQIALIFSGTLGVLGLLVDGIVTLPGAIRSVSPAVGHPQDRSTQIDDTAPGSNGHDPGQEELEEQPHIAPIPHMETQKGVDS